MDGKRGCTKHICGGALLQLFITLPLQIESNFNVTENTILVIKNETHCSTWTLLPATNQRQCQTENAVCCLQEVFCIRTAPNGFELESLYLFGTD